jgi:hypothetical protein
MMSRMNSAARRPNLSLMISLSVPVSFGFADSIASQSHTFPYPRQLPCGDTRAIPYIPEMSRSILNAHACSHSMCKHFLHERLLPMQLIVVDKTEYMAYLVKLN